MEIQHRAMMVPLMLAGSGAALVPRAMVEDARRQGAVTVPLGPLWCAAAGWCGGPGGSPLPPNGSWPSPRWRALGRRVAELAGGQRAQVALGGALARRPGLAVDEPVASPEPLARRELMGVLMVAKADHGCRSPVTSTS
ncbi:hypothetical protein [Amycolatopsis sp. FDAARGOS 1241]|uniref:hypothetical protein n=1 Tax=Amycolatopsis sp. FDAARGOS 1241 TaxID=2778070 RepID=UPI001EF28413|nr:hypothetical protein [Amycolatopsis sp. FDAARGOS 1241]